MVVDREAVFFTLLGLKREPERRRSYYRDDVDDVAFFQLNVGFEVRAKRTTKETFGGTRRRSRKLIL
jgi:hypothetical protein